MYLSRKFTPCFQNGKIVQAQIEHELVQFYGSMLFDPNKTWSAIFAEIPSTALDPYRG